MAAMNRDSALCANSKFYQRSDSAKILYKLAKMIYKINQNGHTFCENLWDVDLLVHCGEQSNFFIQSQYLKKVVLIHTFDRKDETYQPTFGTVGLIGDADA